MNPTTLIVFGAVVVCQVGFSAAAGNLDVEAWMDANKITWGRCQGKKLEFPRPIRDSVKTCAEFRKKSEDSRENVENARKGVVCEGLCLWKSLGLIDGADEISFKKYDNYLEEEFDGQLESTMLKVMKGTKECRKELDFDEKDNIRCRKYKYFFKCIQEVRQFNCGSF